MGRKIIHKRGARENLPELEEAEIALTTDDKKVHIGTKDGNMQLMDQTDKQEISRKLAEVAIGLNNYPRLAIEVTDSPRIKRAVEDIRSKGNRDVLLLPENVIIAEPIKLKTNDKMIGKGEHNTVITLSDNFEGSFAVGLDTLEEGFIELRDFRIDGSNITNITVDGINLTNGYAYNMVGEAQHRLSNIYVHNMSGKGFHFEGKGNMRVERLTAVRCKGTGFDIRVWDSWFDTLDSGLCGTTGIRVSSGPNRLMNCKSWGSNIGFEVIDKRHTLIGCESQENWDYGFVIRGSENLLNISIDGVGFNGSTRLLSDYGVGVQLTQNANNNVIIGTVSNNIFNKNYPNSFKTLLDCNSFGNIIMLSGTDWGKVSENTIDDINNIVNVYSSTAPHHKTKGSTLFRNHSLPNKNGVVIGGDPTRADASGIYENKNGSTNFNVGFWFTGGNGIVGVNRLLPHWDTTDMGSSTKMFRNGYFSGFISGGSYSTTNRPNGVPIGGMIYDTTLKKPIWYNGTNWTDASGTVV